MKKLSCLAFVFVLFLSVPSFADIELGTYTGLGSGGIECSFEVTDFYFEEGLHHPLHERVKILIHGESFVLGHPAEIDEATGEVGFTHEFLSGVRGFAGGAKAAIMTMAHTADYHGPTELKILVDNYRDNSRDSEWTCSGVRRQE